MLEQLIESKNQTETKSIGGYLLTTFILVVGLALSGVLWSLFAKDLAMENDGFALSSLVAPLPLPENAPPPPAPRQPKSVMPAADNIASRQTNMLRLDETPTVAPDKISSVANTQKARPTGAFLISNHAESDFSSSANNTSDRNSGSDNQPTGIGEPKDSQAEVIKPKLPPPPVAQVKKDPLPVQKPVILTGGVVNGKATYLPKPIYSAAAISVNAQGDVSVQVLIDESGNVVSAKAVSGHPLLRAVSEAAARNAKFSPTLLSKQPVKVSGIIVYKFTR